MVRMNKNLLVVLSGPSCSGKTPMLQAVRRLHADLEFARPVPYTSRLPRPGEPEGRDFHFKSEEEIRAMTSDRFLVGKVRAIWQAVDIPETVELLKNNRRVVVELYYKLASKLLEHPAIVAQTENIRVRSVFVSPVSDKEVVEWLQLNPGASPAHMLASISRQRQLRRALRLGKTLTRREMKDIEARAESTWDEMEAGRAYTDYVVNHDGEDSPHWDFDPPLGDAGELVRHFAAILREVEVLNQKESPEK